MYVTTMTHRTVHLTAVPIGLLGRGMTAAGSGLTAVSRWLDDRADWPREIAASAAYDTAERVHEFADGVQDAVTQPEQDEGGNSRSTPPFTEDGQVPYHESDPQPAPL
jgi:hypothetical protein